MARDRTNLFVINGVRYCRFGMSKSLLFCVTTDVNFDLKRERQNSLVSLTQSRLIDVFLTISKIDVLHYATETGRVIIESILRYRYNRVYLASK